VDGCLYLSGTVREQNVIVIKIAEFNEFGRMLGGQHESMEVGNRGLGVFAGFSNASGGCVSQA